MTDKHAITVSNADVQTMLAIEKFILTYDGDDLLHDIDLIFSRVSYRAFFLAFRRAQDAARWFKPEGAA